MRRDLGNGDKKDTVGEEEIIFPRKLCHHGQMHIFDALVQTFFSLDGQDVKGTMRQNRVMTFSSLLDLH